MNKLLKIVFIILLMALLGEMGYYLYSFYGVKTGSEGKSTTTVPTLAPTVSLTTPTSTPIITKRNLKTDITQFVMEVVNNGLIDKSYIVSEYKGKIISLQDQNVSPPPPSASPNSQYQPLLLITLEKDTLEKDKRENPKINFYFNDKELLILKIKRQANGENIELGVQDLKVGQEVMIRETWDLIKNNISSYEITIL